ncbi:MAG: type IX secretion system protein PorQ [Chlorobi bacterium]|nr:type IX secretion system protein PorQ [Chlorobiota bacterium]
MSILKGLSTIFFVIITFFSFGQQGGSSVYQFLNLTNSARVAALGGVVNAIQDDDLNLSYDNPSLLNSSMSNNLVINYVNYFSDINYGYVGFAKSFNKIGNFSTGIHFINYGEFIQADEVGTINGSFKAAEYALSLMYSRKIDSAFSIGINVKPVYSKLEIYDSYGLVADIGLNYTGESRLFTAAFVIKNIGSQITPYRANHYEPVPFNIQAGISQKLAHAPFRLSLVANHLEKYDLTYTNPVVGSNLLVSDNTEAKNDFLKDNADKIMRHIIVGVEILPTPNFYINLGYNYRRRQELKIDTRTYTVGFSWGFGIKVSKFRLSYGRATYHLAGASNHFSLSTNMSDFYRKR